MKARKTAKLEQISKSQKGLYLDDRIWDEAAKLAVKEDRSINYVIEKTLIKAFGIA